MDLRSNRPGQFTDIGRPRPSASSRPVIVGHRPTMPDPMVRPVTDKPLPHHDMNLAPLQPAPARPSDQLLNPSQPQGPENLNFSEQPLPKNPSAPADSEMGPPAVFPQADIISRFAPDNPQLVQHHQSPNLGSLQPTRPEFQQHAPHRAVTPPSHPAQQQMPHSQPAPAVMPRPKQPEAIAPQAVHEPTADYNLPLPRSKSSKVLNILLVLFVLIVLVALAYIFAD